MTKELYYNVFNKIHNMTILDIYSLFGFEFEMAPETFKCLLILITIGLFVFYFLLITNIKVEELPDNVLEEKVIESSNVIQKVLDKAKAGKFKTTEDYNKAMDKVLAKYDPYLKELNKRREK